MLFFRQLRLFRLRFLLLLSIVISFFLGLLNCRNLGFEEVAFHLTSLWHGKVANLVPKAVPGYAALQLGQFDHNEVDQELHFRSAHVNLLVECLANSSHAPHCALWCATIPQLKDHFVFRQCIAHVLLGVVSLAVYVEKDVVWLR